MSVTIEILQLEAIERMGQILHDDIVDAIAAKVAKAARAEWIRLAGDSTLTTTRRDYIYGIQPVHKEGKGRYRISLVGVLPNLLEKGMAQKDLRETLLGPNVPVVGPGQKGGKKERAEGKGYYRSVPFQHAGPSASGAGGLVPMGRPYSKVDMAASARSLGRDIFAQAKALSAYTDPSASASEKRLENPYMLVKGKGGMKQAIDAPKLKPHHQTSIYTGMIRNEQPTKRGMQSTYTTFRTISTEKTKGSDGTTDSWIRPATAGLNLAVKVSEFVARQAPVAFEEYVKGLKG